MTGKTARRLAAAFAVACLASRILPAHPGHGSRAGIRTTSFDIAAARGAAFPDEGITGQGRWRFRVLYTSEKLPAQAAPFLGNAHGGFAVDRRPGRGEVYFALPGAGILRISSDLKQVQLVDTPEPLRKTNLHNTTIWCDSAGNAFLVFPANDAGQLFTTTLDGRLVNTIPAPTPDDAIDEPEVVDYFRKGGKFAPTDVAYLDGLYYVTTGYSDLDYVLTARILATNPFRAIWHDLAFGGKGSSPGRFGTGHGITVPPGTTRLAISDRPNSRISRFTRYGQYRSTLNLPAGAWPCDVDYLESYAVVGCLYGPDRSKGAPVYLLEGDKVISTILPREELGLEKFQHVHNAVMQRVGDRYYLILQAWNPGDFAVLEQVTGR